MAETTAGRGRSVRFRLLAITLLPTLMLLPLLLGITIARWNAKFDAALISKVNGDLTIAHQYLGRILETTGDQIRALGASTRFRDAVEAGGGLDAFLEASRRELGLDFLHIVEPGSRMDWPIVAEALAGTPATAIDIFTQEELAAIDPALAERARIELVPTPNTVPTDRREETRGMVVHAADPVTLGDGRRAALVGGTLLNQNLGFIDTINDLVYREASLPEGSQGTATLFLERMTGTIARVESGDLGARTGHAGARDEIGQVAVHLDHLLDLVEQRDRELRDWNEELNARVAERTGELERANRKLEETTAQLIMSEKLAAIGEITAGVAHEINNPIAVMQGNLEVIRDTLGSDAEEVSTELRLVDEQIQRISRIVTKLLQFAKPEEYAGYVERHAPGDLIADCLPLVQHLLNRTRIEVVREDSATRLVLMNRTELQQVLVNLIVNAIHAMPDGGRLALRSFDDDLDGRRGVGIEVADTGVGMPAETLQQVFDPFFTTKRAEGTGLGLSISQTLVARQGGLISAESVPGRGTTFTVWLPEAG